MAAVSRWVHASICRVGLEVVEVEPEATRLNSLPSDLSLVLVLVLRALFSVEIFGLVFVRSRAVLALLIDV